MMSLFFSIFLTTLSCVSLLFISMRHQFFLSFSHTPPQNMYPIPPPFEDGDVIYGRPLKMPFIFSAWTFSCQRQKKKQKQNIKTNKQKNKQMGKRSKRAIYYTTIIMLTGKNKRRKLMVALRIVQKEIFFVLY